MPAGWGTGHAGFGRCAVHGGRWRAVEEVWRVAIEMARDDPRVSPFEALLYGVAKAHARVEWTDAQLREALRATDGADPMESATVRRWLRESRAERAQLARTAKATVDAGVAERMVRQVELEGRLLSDALAHALDALDLTPDQRFAALEAAHDHLTGAETPLLRALPGRVVPPDDFVAEPENGSPEPGGGPETDEPPESGEPYPDA